MKDALVHLPLEKWTDLKNQFKVDWPRGVSGYTVLETQREWAEKGLEYGFKVFCPFGDVRNGMVALNEKNSFYKVIIQCPTNDTENLEKSLKVTKMIDWRRNIVIPFAPNHVIECIKRVTEELSLKIDLILPSESFILNRISEPFRNLSFPSDVTFDLLKPEHIDLVNSKWPHRYPGSSWYFQLLINAKTGFGLYENQSLISWVFINEAGTIGHMFTLEEYRRKGYGELLMKLVCNHLLEDGKDVFAFAVKENINAHGLYKKLGFQTFGGVAWCYINGKEV